MNVNSDVVLTLRGQTELRAAKMHLLRLLSSQKKKDWQEGPANPSFNMIPTKDLYSAACSIVHSPGVVE